jgi:hypothetical protein
LRPSYRSILDISGLTAGHRLCENTDGLLEEKGLTSWTQPGAADRGEWINQIRTVTTITGPYQLQEDVHANYWGQLAMRNCLRQAYNDGAARGGSCAERGLAGAGDDAVVKAFGKSEDAVGVVLQWWERAPGRTAAGTGR